MPKKDKRKNGKWCPYCHGILKKNGHKNGHQRWVCTKCGKSIRWSMKIRKTASKISYLKKLISYLTDIVPKRLVIPNRQTFWRKTKWFFKINLEIPFDYEYHKTYYVDATRIGGKWLHIIRDSKVVVGGKFYDKECWDSWYDFLSSYPAPKYVVCDGQKGLQSVIKQIWPNSLVQRCVLHLYWNVVQKLTRNPLTVPGQQLLELAKLLFSVNDIQSKNAWIIAVKNWYTKYESFINEKTTNPISGEVFDTHKRLRSAAKEIMRLINNNNLFYYLEDSDVQRTNNKLESEINSVLAERIRAHRGASFPVLKMISILFLLEKSNFKKLLPKLLKQNIKKL